MPPDPAEALRARGLRVTPQRRAILSAFSDRPEEHLSADEVHARAAAVVPEIGRGTVYATLAELTELGLLAAFGAAEPVRYETNTDDHAHFRCRLCLRLFDVDLSPPPAASLERQGYAVERVTIVAEGICRACRDYERGLEDGVAALEAERQLGDAALDAVACAVHATPLGDVMLAASAEGMVRVAFPEHADFDAFASRARARRGPRAARAAPRPDDRRDRRLLRRRPGAGRRGRRLGDRSRRRRRAARHDPPRPLRRHALVRSARVGGRAVRPRLRAGDQPDAVPLPVPPRHPRPGAPAHVRRRAGAARRD